ncbi:hypothetical protein, partial [Methylogaea oryzae]
MNQQPPTSVPPSVLGDDRYRVHISASGTGWSGQGPHALTRDSADPVLDALGFFVYLRDLDAGLTWSPTPAPL